MEVEIQHRPSSAMAKITLGDKEGCVAEAGSMVAIKGDFSITTTTHKRSKGSIIGGLKRLFARESFFLNHYESSTNDDTLYLSCTLPGDMEVIETTGTKMIVQAGSFVACDASIDMNVGWQGFKNMLSGEGLFWLEFSGQGKILMSAFGAIYPVDVDGEYIVDTGHIVAFEETLDFSLSKAGDSWLHSFLGGEGFVCRFKGKGRIWCQSHNPHEFGKAIGPLLKPRQG